MIYIIMRNKNFLRLVRSSFFLERLKLKTVTLVLRCLTGFTYLFIHKVIGESALQLSNSGKLFRGAIKHLTPQLVATTLAYSIPLLLLI